MLEVSPPAALLSDWLLSAEVSLGAGESSVGAVVGWTDECGVPAFLYPEIAGYYLTWLAFLAEVQPETLDSARQRAVALVEWLARVRNGDLPPTRVDTSGADGDDWRSTARFVFDLAMVLRGLTSAVVLAGAPARELQHRWSALVCEQFVSDRELVPYRAESTSRLPDRWSTRDDQHLAKAAAALLSCRDAPERLSEAARHTLRRWAARKLTEVATEELHPALYRVEALLMEQVSLDVAAVDLATIIESLETSEPQRGDVLAQALRAGVILRASGVPGAPSRGMLHDLRARLLEHATPRGSILFTRTGPEHHNVWATMFAHQALVLHDCLEQDMPLPRFWRAHLV